MCLICMVMSALMYLPFLRAYERTLMKTKSRKLRQPSVPLRRKQLSQKRKRHEIYISR